MQMLSGSNFTFCVSEASFSLLVYFHTHTWFRPYTISSSPLTDSSLPSTSAPSNLSDPLSLHWKSMSHSCCWKLFSGYPLSVKFFQDLASIATIHLFPLLNTLTHLMLKQFGIYCFSDYIMGLGNSFVSFNTLLHLNTISATWKIWAHLEYPSEA